MHRLSTAQQAGAILAARRKSLGLSQAAAAAKVGISQNRLSELETKPERLTLDRLISLAGVLGFELVLREKARSPDTGEW